LDIRKNSINTLLILRHYEVSPSCCARNHGIEMLNQPEPTESIMKKSDSPPILKFRASYFVALLSRIRFLLLLAAAITLAGNVRAQFSTIAVDFGGSDPTPGSDDISQLLTDNGSPDKPDTLNYYFDNGTPPGQTFTTGNNPNGYVLNSLYIRTAGLGNLPAGGQSLILRLIQYRAQPQPSFIRSRVNQPLRSRKRIGCSSPTSRRSA